MDTPDDYTVVMHMKRMFPPAVDTIFGESDTPTAHSSGPPAGEIPESQSGAVQRGAGRHRTVRVRALAARRPDRACGRIRRTFAGAPALQAADPDDHSRRQHDARRSCVARGRPRDRDSVRRSTATSPDAPGIARQLARRAGVYGRSCSTRSGRRSTTCASGGRSCSAWTARRSCATTPTERDGSPSPTSRRSTGRSTRSLHPAPYDLAAAKALLDAAGWRPGPDGVRVRNGTRLSLLLVYGIGSQTRAHHHGPGAADVSRARRRPPAQRVRLRDAVRGGAKRRHPQRREVRPGDVRVGLGIGSRRLVAVDVRDDSARRQQRIALLFARDGGGTTARPVDLRPRRAQAARTRRSSRCCCATRPAAFIYYQSLRYAHAAGLRNFHAERHQRGLERPGVAPLDASKRTRRSPYRRRDELTTTIATAKKVPVTVAYGDGIGPEIMDATLRILDAAGAQLDLERIEIGESVYNKGLEQRHRAVVVGVAAPHQGLPEGARSPRRRAAASRASTSPFARRSACTPTCARARRCIRTSRPSIRTWTSSSFARTRKTSTAASSTARPIRSRSASSSSRGPAANASSATPSSTRARTSARKSPASPKTTS